MRTMFNGMIAAVLVTGSAMSAQAESRPGIPAPAAAAKAPNGVVKDKRYCVVETFTGSRIAQKECRTRAEWLRDGFDPLDPK